MNAVYLKRGKEKACIVDKGDESFAIDVSPLGVTVDDTEEFYTLVSFYKNKLLYKESTRAEFMEAYKEAQLHVKECFDLIRENKPLAEKMEGDEG